MDAVEDSVVEVPITTLSGYPNRDMRVALRSDICVGASLVRSMESLARFSADTSEERLDTDAYRRILECSAQKRFEHTGIVVIR